MPSPRYYSIKAARRRDRIRLWEASLRLAGRTALWLAPYSAALAAAVVWTMMTRYGDAGPVASTVAVAALLGLVFGAFAALPVGALRAWRRFTPTDPERVSDLQVQQRNLRRQRR